MAITFRIEDNIGILDFNHPEAKVNLLTADVILSLSSLLDDIQKQSLRALLITSSKKDVFIAGADIKEIENIVEAKDGEVKAKAGQDVLNKIEDLKFPTIAVINGVALGGGCELALSCRYRIGTFNEKLKIGLPEVNLGILPGFGGTYRLPKTVGLTQALKIILAGKVIPGIEAYKIGLLDRLYPEKSLQSCLRQFLLEIEGEKKIKRQRKTDPITTFLEGNKFGQSLLFKQTQKVTVKTTKGFYPAPLKALEVISKSFGLPRAQALKNEAQGFGELVITDVSKSLIKVFYLTEKFKKYMPAGTESIRPRAIRKCGVLGAGIMGGGIAQLLSYKGIAARLKDINYDAIAKGFSAANKVYKELMKRRKLKVHDVQNKMALITGTLDYSGFKNADIVIEAVVENMDVKRKVFKELSGQVSTDTILCSNTSALSVAEMARETRDPSKVAGFHFFNPVHRMPLIEIIQTPQTSPDTIAQLFHFARKLEKTPILVKDSTGFLVNRILLGYINEAGHLLEEGGTVTEIDQIMTDFGMPMGPFTLSDEVGLDVGTKVLHILENAFGSRFKPVAIFEKISAKGLFGKKTNKGFYIHGKKKDVNPEVYQLLGRAPEKQPDFNREEALKRMVYRMINEAALCLDEKVIEDADTVDLGMLMGTGFPPFRGGLLQYGRTIGFLKIHDELAELEAKHRSERFKPGSFLRTLK